MSGPFVGGEGALVLISCSASSSTTAVSAAASAASEGSEVRLTTSTTAPATSTASSPDTGHLLGGVAGLWSSGDGGNGRGSAIRLIAVENFVGMIQNCLVIIFIKSLSSDGISDWNGELLSE